MKQKITQNLKEHGFIKTDLSFYYLLDLIGKGAFGKVYSGIQKITNWLVAIKCLDKIHFENINCIEKI